MTIAEVHQLPLNEKLQIMEAIWDDLCVRADSIPVTQWHKELLDARQKAVAEGREEILDWDEIKQTLGSKNLLRSEFSPQRDRILSRELLVLVADEVRR